MSYYLKNEYGTSNFIRKDPYLYQDMISMQCDSCQKLRISGKVCGKLRLISINRLPVVVIAVHCLLIFITWNAFVKAFRPNQVKKSGGKMGI